SGLDGGGVLDLARELRAALAPFSVRLSAKVSVAVDGGDVLHLDALPADVRLRADGHENFHVALGGDLANAIYLGVVPSGHTIDCVVRLLSTLAERAPQSRMRDAISGGTLSPFTSAVAGLLTDAAPPAA